MFEQQPENIRKKVRELSTAAIEREDPAGWFEELYAQARGDSAQVPWARLTLHPLYETVENWFYFNYSEE